ncbi:transporter [Brucella gallinifaecis]|uniref:Transporter n=2 Tax=Brucella gallinifaecis TaxID=215590 RepID=A0A502BLA5_9HYPH|nr:transporter [Brucella gallinifaecis]
MNFAYIYYTYSNAETSINSALPITGASVNSSIPIFRYAHSFDLNGQIAGIQLVVPYAFVDANLDATRIGANVDGFGDIQAIFLVNLVGAPALSKEAFANWTPEPYLTASLAVSIPTGQYDRERVVNIGANRWGFKPQLSVGVPLGGAADWITANANVQLFTNNDAYHKDKTLAQDPLFTIEAHYSKNLNKALWVSADAFYSYGGQTFVDGTSQDNLQSTLKLGIGGSLNLTPVDAIAVSWNTTVAKKSYTPNSQMFSINFSHAW